jgi:cytochrome c peroxidase
VHTAARRSIARGERLFNTLNIPIKGVPGLNDVLKQDTINGFCGTCHDSPSVGDHSVPAPLNIGLADASRRTPDLPLITLVNNTTGELVQVRDPGRALITGSGRTWESSRGQFCAALLRVHPISNGSAGTLLDAVNFYDTRFDLHLSQQDKHDLVAFLNTL